MDDEHDLRLSLARRFDELAALTRLLRERERELESATSELTRLRGLARQQSVVAELRQRLAKLRQEHEALAADLYRERVDALARSSQPWGVLAPLQRALERRQRRPNKSDLALLRASPLLDAAWYRERYPDAATSGLDAAEHYLRFGALAGHDPGPAFDTRWYLRRYPDVAREGANPLVHYLRHGAHEGRERVDYSGWVRRLDSLSENDRAAIRAQIGGFAARPLVSIVMPVCDPPEHLLRAALDSVRAQLYSDWQLCIADDASTDAGVHALLREYQQQDARISVVYRPARGHISAASNSALELARGEFVALLDHDDLLAEHALYHVAAQANLDPAVEVLYSDEDKVDEDGQRSDPYFKGGWNPDLLLARNYVSHLGVYRTALVREVGGFRVGFEGSQDYDLVLRCLRARTHLRARHIPAVLYHWRTTAGSTALDIAHKPYATTSAVKALREHLPPSAQVGADKAGYRVHLPLPSPAPRVSLLVHGSSSRLMAATTYADLEVLTVDPGASLAAAYNLAAKRASGSVLALLAADLEPVTPEWLSEMVSHAVRADIGAVGALLLTRDATVLHAGLALSAERIVDWPDRGVLRASGGYRGRLFALQNISAVSAACLVVRREAFEAAGALDAHNLPHALFDVDLCLRLREKGLRTLWTPYAELYQERSSIPTPGAAETAHMRTRWGALLAQDPYVSPMATTAECGIDFSRAPPRPWLSRESA